VLATVGALDVEPFRFGELGLVVVRRRDRQDDHLVSLELSLSDGPSRQATPRKVLLRRIEPKRLLDRRRDQRSVASQPSIGLGVLGQAAYQVREQVRSGVVAGQ